MKRHEALVSLSRDHHHALALALRLRRVTPATQDDAARAFMAHWTAEEQHHFRIEEEILLPSYAQHGDPAHPAITRMLQDHIRIRRDAQLLMQRSSLELLRQLGEALAAHVKLEEQEVFPLIERTVPEVDLQILRHRLDTGIVEPAS